MIFDVPGLFSILSHCERGCGYDWRSYSTCRVYSVFDLNAGEVVGMTEGDFSPAGVVVMGFFLVFFYIFHSFTFFALSY